jgi:hypothetical protein
MKNDGGHFTPKFGGHFELESGGHFKLELGGQYHWNLHCHIGKKFAFSGFSFGTLVFARYRTNKSTFSDSDRYNSV